MIAAAMQSCFDARTGFEQYTYRPFKLNILLLFCECSLISTGNMIAALSFNLSADISCLPFRQTSRGFLCVLCFLQFFFILHNLQNCLFCIGASLNSVYHFHSLYLLNANTNHGAEMYLSSKSPRFQVILAQSFNKRPRRTSTTFQYYQLFVRSTIRTPSFTYPIHIGNNYTGARVRQTLLIENGQQKQRIALGYYGTRERYRK